MKEYFRSFKFTYILSIGVQDNKFSIRSAGVCLLIYIYIFLQRNNIYYFLCLKKWFNVKFT